MTHIKNCLTILTPDGANDGGSEILVIDGRIAAIGNNLDFEGTPDDILDATGCVVVPGFVNSHHHFYQTLTRNLPAVQNAGLFDWLVYLYEVWKGIDEQSVYWSTTLAVSELMLTGCTCTTDHHYLYPGSLDADIMAVQFAAAENLGIRFSPTRGSMSLSKKDGGLPPDTVVQDEEVILDDSLRVIGAFHDPSPGSMAKIALAPCSPFSVTKELMKESARIAREHGVRLHTHLAETADEDDYCIERLGMRPLDYMAECDFLGNDVWFAHGIHFNDEELETLGTTKTGICHCPSSNMRLGSGIARVHEMLGAGIPVGLGVDGSASNDSSDMLAEVRNAMLLQRVKYGPDGLSARDALKMASAGGADILGFTDTGRIEVGMCADMSFFDISGLPYAGAQTDPVAAVVFAGIDHRARHVMVNGTCTVREGRLCNVDEEEVAARANEAAAALVAAADL